MRIDRLDLTAFGLFTSETIDLSTNSLHVIHGPNAAGKTTARAAVSSLLYGFGRLSTYAFVHPLNKLQLGARIVDDDKVLEIIRYKRDRDDLIDSGTGLPINQGEWSNFLHGVSKSDFERIYTIGWEELLHGTAELVAGGGALGETLFSSGLGIREFGKVLNDIETEAGRLFAPRAKKLVVNAALSAAEAARKDVSKLSVRPAHYDSVRREHDKIMEKRQRLAGQRVEHDLEIERLTTLRGALPQLRERLRKADERSAILSTGPVQSATWATGVQSALAARIDAGRERSEAETRRDAAADKLAALMPDLEALAIAPDVKTLGESIKAYAEGVSDRSGLELGRSEAELAALEYLRAITGDSTKAEDLEAALPIVGNRKTLVTARDEWISKESTLTLARAAITTREDELTDVTAALAELPASIDSTPLKSDFDAISRKGDLDAALADARVEVLRLRTALVETAGELGLAEDEITNFLYKPLPSEAEVENILSRVEEHLAAAKVADDRIAEVGIRIGELEEELSSLALESDLPSEGELVEGREHREQLWSSIRSSWLDRQDILPADEYEDEATLASTFERSVTNTDETADRLWRNADRTAKRNNLQGNLKRETELRATLVSSADDSRSNAASELSNWVSAWSTQPIPALHTSLRAWSRIVIELKRRNGAYADAKLTHRGAFRAWRDARRQLQAGLSRCGISVETTDRDLASILDEVEGHLETLEQIEMERKRLELARLALSRGLPKQAKARANAEVKREDALTTFRTVSAPYGARVATLIEAGALISQLDDLDKLLSARASRQVRIDGINARSSRFEAEVDRLTDSLGEAVGDSYAEAARKLVRRIDLAAEIQAAREPLLANLATATSAIETADALLSGIEEELRLLTSEQNLEDLDSISRQAERASQVAQLDEDIALCEESLIHLGGGRTIETLEHDAGAHDFSSIDAEISNCREARNALTEAESEAEAAERELDRQLREMDGSDRAALRSADVQFELSKAEDGSARYVRLVLARYLANEAVRRYSEAHQDPILSRASTNLVALTDGAYLKVGVVEDSKKVTLLCATSADGEVKIVPELSSGERDALYISLRLAALEAAVERTGPFPIILDDVLVNLDEEHSASALLCFAELASTSQVLLFTHHSHIVDLAEHVLSASQISVHHLAREKS